MASLRFRLPIGAKRQITLPRALMALLSLEEDDELLVEVVGDQAVLTPVVSIPRAALPEELRRKFESRGGRKSSDIPLSEFLSELDSDKTAKRDLARAGVDADADASVVRVSKLPKSVSALREPGLWHRLFGGDIEQHEAEVYGKAMEAGGAILTLRVAEEDVPKAMGILNQHNMVDVQKRAVELGLLEEHETVPVAPAVAAAIPAKPLTGVMSKDQVRRLADEQLEVGKRLVEQGTTRIRRFVTERPVEESVTLLEEDAEVIRRAITDPSYVRDIDWSDQTIEVMETAEEAVVSKSSKVSEEIVVGKTGSDHVETVHDTVHRQQGEVERVPSTPGTRKR